MKKLLALLLAMLVALSMVACSAKVNVNNNDDDDDDDDKTAQTEKTEGTGEGTGTSGGNGGLFPEFEHSGSVTTTPDNKVTEDNRPTTDPDIPAETEAVTEDDRPTSDTPDTEVDVPVDTPAYAYTAGEISNGKYINYWADLSYTIDRSWTDNTALGNQSIAGTGTEMGLYVQSAATGDGLQIMFEKLPALQSSMTAEAYRNVLKGQLETQYSQMGLTVAGYSEGSRMIGGNYYITLTVRIEVQGLELLQTMCMRNLDGYMVTVLANSYSQSGIETILSGVNCAV